MVASHYAWRPRALSKSFIGRFIIGVSPFRVLITLLITYLLSPLGLQVAALNLTPFFGRSSEPDRGSSSLLLRLNSLREQWRQDLGFIDFFLRVSQEGFPWVQG